MCEQKLEASKNAKQTMKKITLSPFLFICISVHAQFSQVWQTDRNLVSPHEYSFMKIVGNTLYVHPRGGDPIQSAQAFTLEGNENWYMEHSQFNIEESWSFGEVYSVAINSNGDAFGVGKQNAAPYAGRYIYKTNNLGQLEYAEEYFTSTFSSDLNDVKLSADESVMYAFGDKYIVTTNSPHLYKINPIDGAIIDEQEALGAFVFPKKFVLDNVDNIYLNASNVDTLKFMSFDNNLNFRWSDLIEVAGFTGNGEFQTMLYPNGDVLFSTIMNNFLDINDQRLFLARYTSDGDQLWQRIFTMNDYGIANRLPKDIVLDDSGRVYFYFEMRDETVSGPSMPEESNQNDQPERSVILGIRPEIFTFDAQGELIYHFMYPGVSETEYREYPNRIIVDESGYLIGSSSGAEPFGGISLFLLSPEGIMQSELRTEYVVGAKIAGMLYAGNNVFFTHGNGKGLDEGDESKNMVARYSYDYSTGFHTLAASNHIEVFPNPSNSAVTTMISGLNPSFSLQIFSADGRLIYEDSKISSSAYRLNTSVMKKGVYIIKNGNNQSRLLLTN
jgi:hypothetical protein